LTTFNRAACLASESESADTKTEWVYEERKPKSLSSISNNAGSVKSLFLFFCTPLHALLKVF
jgi:hypothetical protein